MFQTMTYVFIGILIFYGRPVLGKKQNQSVKDDKEYTL